MNFRIAINGFGRIGRKVFRALNSRPGFEVVAINDLAPVDTLVHLLRRDSVHGSWNIDVEVGESGLVLEAESGGTWRPRVLACKDPEALPWREIAVDCVLECTGRYSTPEAMQAHLRAGAGSVLLSAPAKGRIDATIVYGVNHETLLPEHKLIQAASCTTNCLAPLVKVIDQRFGLECGLLNTVHAYTNDQALLDLPHKDLRRARSAAINIVPTSTGAAEAVALVYPPVAGKLTGVACRVPVAAGSLVDLTVMTTSPVTPEELNAAMAEAAAGELAGILEYSEEPLVSQDIVGNPHSSVLDSLMTRVVGGRMVKVFSWYDNEWGYSHRLADVACHIAEVRREL